MIQQVVTGHTVLSRILNVWDVSAGNFRLAPDWPRGEYILLKSKETCGFSGARTGSATP